ncbi:MAG: type II toxin-antitoxin system VapC family toxin [bacterium]
MNNIFILDACSLIAFLNAEEGGDKLKALLEDASNEIYMHLINLCEVYYGFYKVDGEKRAEEVITNLLKLPIEYVEEMPLDFVKIVGRYKATYRISLADAFVLALAEVKDGQIVTTDHKEFDPINKEGKLKFLWLR